MPLSEHEERILAEIERRLTEDDPRFVRRTRRAGDGGGEVLRLRLAVLGFLLGLAFLLGLTFHIALGFVGFTLMFVSTLAGVAALRGGGAAVLPDRLRRAFDRRDHAR